MMLLARPNRQHESTVYELAYEKESTAGPLLRWASCFRGTPMLVGALSRDHVYVRGGVPLVSIIQASLLFYILH